MPAFVTKEAPDFTADAVVNEEFKTVKLADYRGKYVVLFFYPLDFTFVCPTEIIAFSEKNDEFRKRGAEVLGVSVDSKFSHLNWIRQSRADGGLGGLKYPLVSDLSKKISADYGVLVEEGPNKGVALRGTFLIDKNGILRHALINDLPLGRSIDESIRIIDALHFFEQHGEVCPANWKPGALTIDTKNAGKYFKAANA